MNAQLTRDILGDLILRPGLLEESDLTANDFPAGRERETFMAIAEIWEATRQPEIPLAVLAEKISGASPAAFVASLVNGNIPKSAAAFALAVGTLRRRALTFRVLQKIEEQAKAGELDLDEIRPDLDAYDALRSGAEEKSPLMTFAEFQKLEGRVEWTVENLLPAGALTMLTGSTGIGKSWLALQIAHAVSTGTPLFGLAVKRRPVLYVGLEDPRSTTKQRAIDLGLAEALIWHGSFAERPPKMDSPDWIRYKKFAPPGSLIIFDTVRQCHEMEENSSEAPAIVLGRWKELRDLGHEILAIHHPTKADATNPRGAGGWTDGCDHTLSLVRHGKEEDDMDEGGAFEPGCLLTLGTGRKSRFESPGRIYVRLEINPTRLVLAESPDLATLDALAEYIAGEGLGQNQGDIIAWAKENRVGPRRLPAFLALLKRGEAEGRWTVRRGLKGSKHYEPPL